MREDGEAASTGGRSGGVGGGFQRGVGSDEGQCGWSSARGVNVRTNSYPLGGGNPCNFSELLGVKSENGKNETDDRRNVAALIII